MMITKNLRSYILLIIFLAIILIFSILCPQFRTYRNFFTLLRQVSFVGIMAIGATFVILGGGIDLSVGSMLALSGMICVRFLKHLGLGTIPTVILVLIAGALMGYVNGKLYSRFKIPPFIVTLSTMGIYRGLTWLFAYREYGFIKNVPITNETFLKIGGSKIGLLYSPTLFFIFVAIIGLIYLRYSKFGTYVYAIGSKEESAKMSGINVNYVKTKVFVISGICSALAGIIWTSRLMTSTTEMGLGNELDVIAAIVVGGTSILGGRGGITQTILGVLFIGTITNGLSMMGLPAYYQPLAKAVLIVSAASLDSFMLMKETKEIENTIKGQKNSKVFSTGNRKGYLSSINRSQKFLELKDISKSFSGIKVLNNVSLDIAKGEVHALIGENGAGKSTLIKIITGYYHKDEGKILVNGKEVNINNPREAQSLGISTVFQEFSLIPTLNVVQNIMLGREPEAAIPIFIDHSKLSRLAQAVLDKVKFYLPMRTNLEHLSVAANQMTEIAKALSLDASMIIMDEPTASLSTDEKDKLFETIRTLSSHGVSILFISHILEEVLEIAHTLTVLRDGKIVATEPSEHLDKNKIIQYMVGRELIDYKVETAPSIGAPVLQVEGLSRGNAFQDITFSLHKGEILGLTGLVGAGRTELGRAIFGLDYFNKGKIKVFGKEVKMKSPKVAMNMGIAFLSEDKKREELVLIHSMMHNITMANLEGVSNKLNVISHNKEIEIAETYVKKMDIRPINLNISVLNLSGGNQQKVVLGKWLSRVPQILIVDEPTVGIDIGAKHEIYRILNELSEQGVSILLISSDFSEIQRMCYRTLIMRKGKIVAEFSSSEISSEEIMKASMG